MSKPTFLEGSDAARQAEKDLLAFSKELDENGMAGKSNRMISAAGVSAGAAVANVLIGAFNAGSGLAADEQTANESNHFLEITIRNLSTNFNVIPYEVDPSSVDISNTPGPIMQGASDVLLLADENGSGFKHNEAAISWNMLISGIDVKAKISLTDTGRPGRWKPQLTIDGSSSEFSGDLTLKGAICVDGKFSIYTSPIETTSGSIDITIIDMGS